MGWNGRVSLKIQLFENILLILHYNRRFMRSSCCLYIPLNYFKKLATLHHKPHMTELRSSPGLRYDTVRFIKVCRCLFEQMFCLWALYRMWDRSSAYGNKIKYPETFCLIFLHERTCVLEVLSEVLKVLCSSQFSVDDWNFIRTQPTPVGVGEHNPF
jgi:hypothetical protein